MVSVCTLDLYIVSSLTHSCKMFKRLEINVGLFHSFLATKDALVVPVSKIAKIRTAVLQKRGGNKDDFGMIGHVSP